MALQRLPPMQEAEQQLAAAALEVMAEREAPAAAARAAAEAAEAARRRAVLEGSEDLRALRERLHAAEVRTAVLCPGDACGAGRSGSGPSPRAAAL